MTFDTCGSNFSTLLAAYQSTSVDALHLVYSPPLGNPPSCTTGGRVIRFDIPHAGGTFYIAVDGASGPAVPDS